MKRWRLIWAAGVLAGATALAAAPQTMNVQIRSAVLRANPTPLGRPVGALSFGESVNVRQTSGSWLQVQAASGAAGWVHQSALARKESVIRAGDTNVSAAASAQEVSLAMKGFTPEVEREYRLQHGNVDFTWVDRMEACKVTDEQAARFLAEGGVKGGRP